MSKNRHQFRRIEAPKEARRLAGKIIGLQLREPFIGPLELHLLLGKPAKVVESLESGGPENPFNKFFGRSPPKELIHSLLYKVMLKLSRRIPIGPLSDYSVSNNHPLDKSSTILWNPIAKPTSTLLCNHRWNIMPDFHI